MISKQTFDLASVEWTVAGFLPTSWTGKSMETGFAMEPVTPVVPARVPGSVQLALREAGLLPDWFVGLHAQECEWVENRDWMFSARLPDPWFTNGRRFILNCEGLDGEGLVVFNKTPVGWFNNSFIPYRFDLTDHALPRENQVHLIFRTPPRWLGQVGYTSQMKDWKVRFNYTWDWIPRLVQIGPWEQVTLETIGAPAINTFRCHTDWDAKNRTGTLWMACTTSLASPGAARVRLTLRDGETVLKQETLPPEALTEGFAWSSLPVEPWWPNGEGGRRLYSVACEMLDETGTVTDKHERTVGFKHVDWRACENAPEGADPWICVVNGRPIFLQGINWTPIRPNFADLTFEDYRRLIVQYAELGCNIFRVWGGGFLEKTWFYDLCDKYGLLVWQEFPLSSSGHENWPHEDEPSMRTLVQVAESYIVRRQHHASLLMWCGGNELQGSKEGGKVGIGLPVTLSHPLMHRWAALVERLDPGRRFVPTSASGPSFYAREEDFGKGLHWDVHGPWKGPGANRAAWAAYWNRDDALFRSETGAPGASSAALIRQYAGGLPATPGTLDNPLWRRFSWWLEWGDFVKELGREPATLEEYVEWSQARQATAIALAIRSCKARFPAVGGILLWMGHDAFPCMANTAIIDFHMEPKPAALAASEIWRTPVKTLT